MLPAAADFLCCLPGCSQQQQGALGCSPGPDMCSLHMFSAVAWCYQQQLSLCCCWLLPAAVVPLLLSGYHQQQQWASGCSPWPCFFFTLLLGCFPFTLCEVSCVCCSVLPCQPRPLLFFSALTTYARKHSVLSLHVCLLSLHDHLHEGCEV